MNAITSDALADDLTPDTRAAARPVLRKAYPIRSAILWPILMALLPVLIRIVLEILQARHPEGAGMGLAMSGEDARRWRSDQLPEVKEALAGRGDRG
jgi:hypothetical protein